MEKNFIILACINQVNALGKDNKLLYHIGNDMKNFKAQTMGNVVVMGRNTFESLPGKKPLDGRINIVITNDKEFSIDANESVYIVHLIEDALDLCETIFPDKDWYVIGGASIYEQFLAMDLVKEMRLTIVNDNADGDVYFPPIKEDEWMTYYQSLSQTAAKKQEDGTTSKTSFTYHILRKKTN